MGWIWRIRRGDRGANLVEFALIAPLLFLLLFGVIEFARLIHGFTTVWTAAREGARYATTVGDTGPDNFLDCNAIIDTALGKVFGTGSPQITVEYFNGATAVADCSNSTPLPEPDDVDIDAGYDIRVTADAQFDAIVPLLSAVLDGIDLTSSQVRTIQYGVVSG